MYRTKSFENCILRLTNLNQTFCIKAKKCHMKFRTYVQLLVGLYFWGQTTFNKKFASSYCQYIHINCYQIRCSEFFLVRYRRTYVLKNKLPSFLPWYKYLKERTSETVLVKNECFITPFLFEWPIWPRPHPPQRHTNNHPFKKKIKKSEKGLPWR